VVGQIRDELAAEPGVKSVGVAEVGLMTGSNSSSSVIVDGYTSKEGEDLNPNFNGVSPGFFSTMGIPLVRGRDFTDGDALQAPKVAIVNEVFADYFFKGQDVLGRTFRLERDGLPYTIVGLVRDGRKASMREEPIRYVYTPYMQEDRLADVTFYVRTVSDAVALGGRLPRLVARADAGLPVKDVRTMQARIGESLFVDRIVASLSAAFGFLATLLAAIGLYGVMSHAVAMRTREIGIRMALGAERRMVVAMVLREVALLTAIGIVIGLPSGYGLGRAVESQLFGLKAADPLTFALATAVLVTASLLAGLVPAARATRVHPLVALRYE
jgi:predicted permease